MSQALEREGNSPCRSATSCPAPSWVFRYIKQAKQEALFLLLPQAASSFIYPANTYEALLCARNFSEAGYSNARKTIQERNTRKTNALVLSGPYIKCASGQRGGGQKK